jgi:hypothetical protein
MIDRSFSRLLDQLKSQQSLKEISKQSKRKRADFFDTDGRALKDREKRIFKLTGISIGFAKEVRKSLRKLSPGRRRDSTLKKSCRDPNLLIPNEIILSKTSRRDRIELRSWKSLNSRIQEKQGLRDVIRGSLDVVRFLQVLQVDE